MDLFHQDHQPQRNYLPQQGTVHFYGYVLSKSEANAYYQKLLNTIDWKNDEAIIFGKRMVTKRKVAWYGNEAYEYGYSNTTKIALSWTPELVALKALVEKVTGETYNSCLLNLYHNGSEGMAWHSDAEKKLQKNGAIASLSLGAERKFSFKHKVTKEKIDLHLTHGSLLVMKGETQTHWLHRLPPTQKVTTPRINLTFRSIVENGLF